MCVYIWIMCVFFCGALAQVQLQTRKMWKENWPATTFLRFEVIALEP